MSAVPNCDIHSRQSDMIGSELAVANLHNQIDIYSIPSLNLVQSFAFSIKINTLYKFCIASNVWVVAGGENGCAHLYNLQQGELLQMIQHAEGEHIPLSQYFLSHLCMHLPDIDDELIQLVTVSVTLLKADKQAADIQTTNVDSLSS